MKKSKIEEQFAASRYEVSDLKDELKKMREKNIQLEQILKTNTNDKHVSDNKMNINENAKFKEKIQTITAKYFKSTKENTKFLTLVPTHAVIKFLVLNTLFL